MPFDRVLIGVDGSRGGEAAARLGGELAAGGDAEVLLVYAVPLPPIVPGVDQAISDESLNYLEETAANALESSADILAAMSVKSEQIMKAGSPADVILSVAEERDVDVIVVGHRGFGAMKRFILGSVSSKLAHNARCALLLAPVEVEPT